MSLIKRSALSLEDTIFALSSGGLPCAVAILRLSGPRAFAYVQERFRAAAGSWMPQRGMAYGVVLDALGRKIDSVVLLSFVAPNSFTGQDVIEIQCHGSLAIVEKLQSELVEFGCRTAEKGEFSYRAFLYGRLDASELENLGDLFLARDAADLNRVFLRKDACLESEIQKVKEDLTRLQAILDTAVDFSEEYGHVAHSSLEPLSRAKTKCTEIAGRYEAFRSGSGVPRLVLAGRPNAGKSSLFNALLCRYRAIVHEMPGTTRDVIEDDIELGGRRWKLVDTAGVRVADSRTEQQGIELGADFLAAASFWILVIDGTKGISESEHQLLEQYGATPHLVVWNKKDLPNCLPADRSSRQIPVSALTGDSVLELVALLEARAAELQQTAAPLPTSLQSKRLREAAGLLGEIEVGLAHSVPPEVLGELNRTVLRTLESVVGEVGVEEVLDRVFSEFCIGK